MNDGRVWESRMDGNRTVIFRTGGGEEDVRVMEVAPGNAELTDLVIRFLNTLDIKGPVTSVSGMVPADDSIHTDLDRPSA